MNKKLFNVLVFTAGAAVGSLVTWKVVKTKYERIAQEEIDSVKETWERRYRQDTLDDTPCDDDGEFEGNEEIEDDDEDIYIFDESDKIAYHKLAEAYKQSGAVTENDGEGEGDEEVPYINGPVVIVPEDFGDGNYDHDIYCLTYYSDGVLSNDWYEKLDIDETIGQESLEHFGDYIENIVHVRNERLKADYEVARDEQKYADLVANDPLVQAYADRRPS